MAKGVVQFSITNDASDYVLSIEDEDGNVREFCLSFEQLDLMQEAIAEHLDTDLERALAVDGDEGDDDA